MSWKSTFEILIYTWSSVSGADTKYSILAATRDVEIYFSVAHKQVCVCVCGGGIENRKFVLRLFFKQRNLFARLFSEVGENLLLLTMK